MGWWCILPPACQGSAQPPKLGELRTAGAAHTATLLTHLLNILSRPATLWNLVTQRPIHETSERTKEPAYTAACSAIRSPMLMGSRSRAEQLHI